MSLTVLPDDESRVLAAEVRGEPITTDEAKKRLWVALTEALRSGENTLITAPTSLGKTYTVATTPWRQHPDITGGEPVLHISQTTEARDQAAAASEQAGISYHVLRARDELCSVARGEHDGELRTPDRTAASEWLDRKCDDDGVSFKDAHGYLAAINRGLPCSKDEACPAFTQYENVPRVSEGEGSEPTYDVIHASAAFARLGNIVAGSNVIFDERPSYSVEMKDGRVRESITDLLGLRTSDESGTYTWESFIQQVKSKPYHGTTEELEEWNKQMEVYERLFKKGLGSEERFGPHGPIHELTPAVGRAISNIAPVGNGRYRGQDGTVKVVLDDKNRVRVVHDAPDLSRARCVIGLDAHPAPRLWELNTVSDLSLKRLLSDDETRYWRTQERGLYVVQVGQYTRPITKGWRNQKQEAEVEHLVRGLRGRFDDGFRTAICPSAVKDDVEAILRAAGVEDPELMHYGGEKSRNDFKSESVGLLVGCIDPGDEGILNDLALLNLRAEPETVEDDNGEEKRAYGRGFTGPDADAAKEFLWSVRETHIAQSIGRYARDVNEDGAVVYVWSDAIPGGMVDANVPGVLNRSAKKRDAVEEFIIEHGPVTPRQIMDGTGVSKSHTNRTCNRLVEEQKVRILDEKGPNGGYLYEYVGDDSEDSVSVDLQITGKRIVPGGVKAPESKSSH